MPSSCVGSSLRVTACTSAPGTGIEGEARAVHLDPDATGGEQLLEDEHPRAAGAEERQLVHSHLSTSESGSCAHCPAGTWAG